MLKATIVGTEAVVQRFTVMPDTLQERIRQAIERFTMRMSADVRQNRLSGQTLRVRTGRLRRSVHHEVTVEPGRVTGTVGTNVRYGRIHEFGGTVQIPAHARQVSQVFGRPLPAPIMVQVRAHTARFPTRSFLRSTLLASTLRFREAMKRVAAEAGN
jgi:phage gpG-like protein